VQLNAQIRAFSADAVRDHDDAQDRPFVAHQPLHLFSNARRGRGLCRPLGALPLVEIRETLNTFSPCPANRAGGLDGVQLCVCAAGHCDALAPMRQIAGSFAVRKVPIAGACSRQISAAQDFFLILVRAPSGGFGLRDGEVCSAWVAVVIRRSPARAICFWEAVSSFVMHSTLLALSAKSRK